MTLHNHPVHTWTKIFVGQLLILSENDKTFLNVLDSTNRANLSKKSLQKKLRNNFAPVRAFVCQQRKATPTPAQYSSQPSLFSLYLHPEPGKCRPPAVNSLTVDPPDDMPIQSRSKRLSVASRYLSVLTLTTT